MLKVKRKARYSYLEILDRLASSYPPNNPTLGVASSMAIPFHEPVWNAAEKYPIVYRQLPSQYTIVNNLVSRGQQVGLRLTSFLL